MWQELIAMVRQSIRINTYYCIKLTYVVNITCGCRVTSDMQ